MSDSIVFGSLVTVHYRVSLEDGTEVDSSFDEAPIEFTLGDGTFPEGVELVLYGMSAGERDARMLLPLQAWGSRDAQKIHSLARSDFPAELVLQEGQVLAFDLPNGEQLPGAILSIGETEVKVDFNPPLAGQSVRVEFEVLDVQPPEVDVLADL
jgi:FKBP-type peptidyl-prolyl cis-trans isomerase SlpA